MPDSWNPPYQDIIPPLLRLRGYYSFLLLLYTQLFSFPWVYSPIFSLYPQATHFSWVYPSIFSLYTQPSHFSWVYPSIFLSIPSPLTFLGYIRLFFSLYPARSLSLGISVYFSLYTQPTLFPWVYLPILPSYTQQPFFPWVYSLIFPYYTHPFHFLWVYSPIFSSLYPARSLSLGIFAYFPFLYPAGLPSSGYNLPVFAFYAPLSQSSRGLASFFDSLCPVLSIFPGLI